MGPAAAATPEGDLSGIRLLFILRAKDFVASERTAAPPRMVSLSREPTASEEVARIPFGSPPLLPNLSSWFSTCSWSTSACR